MEIDFPSVPEMIHDTTGGEIDIEGVRDRFFNEVVNFVGFNERARRAFVDVRRQELCDPYSSTAQPTDNFVSLWMRDYPVASSWEYRTPFNMVEVQFHLYLDEKLLAKLRDNPILLVENEG